MKEKLIERLVRYAKIDTQSDADSSSTPSTPGQWDLLHVLQKELADIGLEEITLDENGYLFATLPANTDRDSTGHRLSSTCRYGNRLYREKRQTTAD